MALIREAPVSPIVGESGANWHPTCFCSRGCCQPMAMMFLCCTRTNQNTKNSWRPNPSWFKNYHDKPFLNHMSILFNKLLCIFIVMLPQWWKFLILLTRCYVCFTNHSVYYCSTYFVSKAFHKEK